MCHLKSEHKNEYLSKAGNTETIQRPITSIFERPSTTPFVPARKSQIDSAVEKYIIDSLRPISTIEEPAFIELMKVMQPAYQLPSRKTILSHFNKMYDSLVADLKSELSYCHDVNFTHDIWSSLNPQS